MRKAVKAGLAGILLSATVLGSAMVSYAGSWQSDAAGWWWKNDDGSYPTNNWQWIDGDGDGVAESYYFNESGYCLLNTTTPDGYTVNESGAWIANGQIQTKVTNMTAKADLFTMKPEYTTSWQKSNHESGTIGGEDWSYQNYMSSSFKKDEYVDFYLGGAYTKLVFKMAPYASYWTRSAKVDIKFSDKDTGAILHQATLTNDSNVTTVTIDVTGVQYLRLNTYNRDGNFGRILFKDGLLY